MSDETPTAIPPSGAREALSPEEIATTGNVIVAPTVENTYDHAGGQRREEPSVEQSHEDAVLQLQPWNGEALLVEMRDMLTGLRRDFESKLMYDTGKQRQLDVLHEELETYRRGFHLQLLRPVITDLIALFVDMEKVASRLTSAGAHAEAVDEIGHFRTQIEEILRRNGVERFTSQTEVFDAGRQRAITVVETSDPANDKRIAERVRPGFEYEGKIVVQVEQVKTYRYVPPVDSAK